MAQITNFFAGANGGDGFQNLFHRIVELEDTYDFMVLKGGPGVGKNTFMKEIGRVMEQAGTPVEYLWCSGDPDSLDGVVLPELRCAVADGTSPHGSVPKGRNGETGRFSRRSLSGTGFWAAAGTAGHGHSPRPSVEWVSPFLTGEVRAVSKIWIRRGGASGSGAFDGSTTGSLIAPGTIAGIDKSLCIVIAANCSLIGNYIFIKDSSRSHHFWIVRAVKNFNASKSGSICRFIQINFRCPDFRHISNTRYIDSND